MNEPTVHAQKSTGKVTAKDVLSILKGCESASLYGRAALGRATWSDSFVFDLVATYRRRGIETSREVSVPGWVSNGHDNEKKTYASFADGRKTEVYCGTHRPERGFWWLYAVTDRVIDVLDLLPSNAEIAFHVYLDAGTNATLTDATLHADHLYMVATYTSRGKQVQRRFLIDASAGAHTTARFGVYR